jgi:hypothetical protein
VEFHAQDESVEAVTKRKIENYTHSKKQRINNPPVGLVTAETDRWRNKRLRVSSIVLACFKRSAANQFGHGAFPFTAVLRYPKIVQNLELLSCN